MAIKSNAACVDGGSFVEVNCQKYATRLWKLGRKKEREGEV